VDTEHNGFTYCTMYIIAETRLAAITYDMSITCI